MKRHKHLIVFLLIIFLTSACMPVEPSPSPGASTAVPTQTMTGTAFPTRTLQVNQFDPSATTTQRVSTTQTPIPPISGVCSPLLEVPISQLDEIIVNPFSPPPPGSDDPHQGVDFADLYGTERIAVSGRGVQAVLSGTVAAVIVDRFPYGNAILVETMIGDLPEALAGSLPTPAPTPERRAALTCPQDVPIPDWKTDQRSLYLLYAHLLEPPVLQPGDSLTCGQDIGTIGSSGNALNPHLHLEARIGPSTARFASMAHYEARATSQEMASYCLWRTSGIFQLVDPLALFREIP
jgi:murein DD-endopeptidase MepM/ murein hydrolase activator NlpD